MKYLYTKKLVKIRLKLLYLKSRIGVFLTKKGINDAQGMLIPFHYFLTLTLIASNTRSTGVLSSSKCFCSSFAISGWSVMMPETEL